LPLNASVAVKRAAGSKPNANPNANGTLREPVGIVY
jgi:hypothetical protein